MPLQLSFGSTKMEMWEMFVEFVADFSFRVFLLSSKTRQSFRSAQKTTAGVQ